VKTRELYNWDHCDDRTAIDERKHSSVTCAGKHAAMFFSFTEHKSSVGDVYKPLKHADSIGG